MCRKLGLICAYTSYKLKELDNIHEVLHINSCIITGDTDAWHMESSSASNEDEAACAISRFRMGKRMFYVRTYSESVNFRYVK